MSRRILLVLAAVIGGAALAIADDPPLEPAVVEARLKQRRSEVDKLEGFVQALRNDVKRDLSDIVVGQEAVVAQARFEVQKAKEEVEVSRYKVREYLEGVYLQDRVTLLGQVKLSEADLERAIDRFEEHKAEAKNGVVDPIRLTILELDKQQAEFDLEQSKLELDVLEKYSKDKEVKVREAAVTSARAIETEKKARLELEQAKEAKLRDQAAKLHVRSPEDLVIALIDDAVMNEGKAVAVLGEAQKIEAQIREKTDQAEALNRSLVGKKDEAVALMNRAKTELLEAVNLGEQVKAKRIKLREAESKLKKERQLLETLEQQLSPKK